MLVLTRKNGESLCIGDGIRVTVTRIHGNKVRLGIEAPADVPIRRSEIAPINKPRVVAAPVGLPIEFSDSWNVRAKAR